MRRRQRVRATDGELTAIIVVTDCCCRCNRARALVLCAVTTFQGGDVLCGT